MVNLSPQQLEIYLFLKNKQPETGHISEITNDKSLGGLGIKGYTERHSELRRKGFSVVSVQKNYYRLVSEPDWSVDDLRELYIEAKKRGYYSLCERIVVRAKTINNQIKNVKEALL